jgi:hypothetical protein
MGSRKAQAIRSERVLVGNRVAKSLDKRVKSCKKINDKKWPEIKVIKLDYISVGDLRQRFSPQHQPLPPTAQEEVDSFEFYLSDGIPIAIFGSDNHLLVLRFRCEKPESVKLLAEAIDNLPSMKKLTSKGINRGPYVSVHYGTWCPYMPTPQTTREQRAAGEAANELLAIAKPIFDDATAVLAAVEPGVFEEFMRFELPDDAQRACGAWAACVVNNGGVDADEGKFHRDVRESPYGFSCALACGDFEQGHLVLYELRKVLEMKPCDIILFPDSLITHKNTKVKGRRKSVVAFTQANMFEYWKRVIPGVKVKWDRWKRINRKGEVKIVGESHEKGKKRDREGDDWEKGGWKRINRKNEVKDKKKDPRECWAPNGKVIEGPRATRSGAILDYSSS